MLTPESLPVIQTALTDAALDGWLLYDFRGSNPIARDMVRLEGMATRRIFVFIPRDGLPTAITHDIEQGLWRHWPSSWCRVRYSAWRMLDERLRALVRGKRVAMEYSAGDAVPYIDRVPAGVIEMVRAAGATVVTSGELVTRFYAVWTAADLASHRRAAEQVAAIARGSFAYARERLSGGGSVAEHEPQAWILDRFDRAGLETQDAPIVGVGANAADGHYGPSADRPVLVERGKVLLVDLWAREPGGVFADQTWMGVAGPPSDRVATVWSAVRDARKAAVQTLRNAIASRTPLRGADVDDAARAVITQRGFEHAFLHRTGHSIDVRSLHGSGPNMDNFETHEERMLAPGVGFSIEPGIYIEGELGVRSEVNAWCGAAEVVVTPRESQEELEVV